MSWVSLRETGKRHLGSRPMKDTTRTGAQRPMEAACWESARAAVESASFPIGAVEGNTAPEFGSGHLHGKQVGRSRRYHPKTSARACRMCARSCHIANVGAHGHAPLASSASMITMPPTNTAGAIRTLREQRVLYPPSTRKKKCEMQGRCYERLHALLQDTHRYVPSAAASWL